MGVTGGHHRDTTAIGTVHGSVHFHQPKPTAATGKALRRYREWVVRQSAHLDLGDLGSAPDAGRSGGRLKLARVYVELDTTSSVEPEKGRGRTGGQPSAIEDEERAQRLSAVGALLKHRRLALLGPARFGQDHFAP